MSGGSAQRGNELSFLYVNQVLFSGKRSPSIMQDNRILSLLFPWEAFVDFRRVYVKVILLFSFVCPVYDYGFPCWSGGMHSVMCFNRVCGLSTVCCVYRIDRLVHTYINTHTHAHTDIDKELCSDHCQAKACNMIRTLFFHMNTDVLHVSTRSLTSFQHGERP